MTPLNWIPLLQFKTNPTPDDVKFVLGCSSLIKILCFIQALIAPHIHVYDIYVTNLGDCRFRFKSVLK